jgi:hypothetical protein
VAGSRWRHSRIKNPENFTKHRSPIVKYTLRSIEKPIGVSSYRVTRELPTPIREEVPTVEDLQEVVTKLRDEMELLRQKRSDEE